jgi:broad specificity phosphatase PhoE
MGTIYLIRHGQAGSAHAEYDLLSDLGAVQSRLLGAHLVAAQLRVDVMYCAPRRRHLETAREMHAGAQSKGGKLPELSAAPHFDEFPFADIVRAACETGLGPEYAALTAELGGKNPLHDARAFTQLFRLSMQRWAAGTVSGPESFVDFTARVQNGLRSIMAEQGRGRSIAVVTSAGAIAAVLMHLLDLTSERMLRLCLGLRNTSYSELRFRGDEISVISVNEVPHLIDPAHRTFR